MGERRGRRNPWHHGVRAAAACVAVVATAGSAAAAEVAGTTAAPQRDAVGAREVRSTWAADAGLARPAGIAYVPRSGSLVIADTSGGRTRLVRLSLGERRLGSVGLSSLARPSTLSFDARGGRLTAVDGADLVSVSSRALAQGRATARRSDLSSLGVSDARGASYDARTGAWYVLDGRARALVRLASNGSSSRIPLRGLAGERLRGLAHNPADGLLYVASPSRSLLYGVDTAGRVKVTYSLAPLALLDLRAFVFAPTADPTDDARALHLYAADAGAGARQGRIVEIELVPRPQFRSLTLAATFETGVLVQLIHTSQYSPSSPDPAGVTYDAATDRLLISDSEVDEMTIYQGINLYSAARTGGGTGTGTTRAYSAEPTGVGLRASDRTLFASDDDRDRIYIVKPGADGKHGTADDTVTSFSTATFGSTDPEGVEYDEATGHLFIADGTGIEVYEVDPVNGVFGDADDIATHFDVAQYGSRDCEGIGGDPQRGTLLVVDPSTKKIYELSKSGALVRTIDLATLPLTNRLFAGVTAAPSSDPNDAPSKLNYWVVDRQIDNNQDPNENDGKLYEIAVPSADSPPAVTLTAPAEGATVSGTVTVQASASDDNGVTQVAFSVGGVSIGTDTNGADGWSVSWNTAGVADGSRTVTATATDTAGQTASDSNTVTVDNADSAPSVTLTQPAEGATLTGTAAVQATASDDVGVTQVRFSVGALELGVDTNGADGWSASWNTSLSADGAHTVTATASDTAGQSTSDSNAVTVDNNAPTVDVTSPAAGANVSGTVTLEASAADTVGVVSVRFLVDGLLVATDTNGSNGWSIAWDSTAVADGAHGIAAVARDGAGHEATSAGVGVTVDNPDVVVLNVPIQLGVDDADEAAGVVRRTRGDLELGMDKEGSGFVATTVGLRFAGLAIPQGAEITSAYVQFQVDERGKGESSLVFRGQQADNAPSFTSAANDISSRPTTSASVAWSPSTAIWAVVGAAGPDQRTPSLTAVLQEIVNRPGWASGNALVIVVTGSGRRTAESFEGGFPPVLHVEYARGG